MGLDIPSPVDLRIMAQARDWERSALGRRPARPQFFDAMLQELISLGPAVRRVLDLGSGPGFLALRLLGGLPHIRMVLLTDAMVLHRAR